MSKKSSARRRQKPKPSPVRRSTSIPKRPTTLDRFTMWLGRRSRLTRIIISAAVALTITGAIATLLYGALLNTPPERLTFGPLNVSNIFWVILLALGMIGFSLYWYGWRLLVGFDFAETPHQPGRAAALWVVFGIMIALGALVSALIATLVAAGPA